MKRQRSHTALTPITVLMPVAALPASLAQDHPTRGARTRAKKPHDRWAVHAFAIGMMPCKGLDPASGTPAKLAAFL